MLENILLQFLCLVEPKNVPPLFLTLQSCFLIGLRRFQTFSFFHGSPFFLIKHNTAYKDQNMRSAQDVSVRWRVSCSLALVLLLRLARCKPVPELESWWMVDFLYLDGIHKAFTLPADDEAAQLVRHVYWREAGHMWSALMKALALLQTAWIHLQGRGPLHTHVLAGWHVFRQMAMSAFCDADIQELRNAMGSDCADWRSCAASAVTCEHPKQSSYVVQTLPQSSDLSELHGTIHVSSAHCAPCFESAKTLIFL